MYSQHSSKAYNKLYQQILSRAGTCSSYTPAQETNYDMQDRPTAHLPNALLSIDLILVMHYTFFLQSSLCFNLNENILLCSKDCIHHFVIMSSAILLF